MVVRHHDDLDVGELVDRKRCRQKALVEPSGVGGKDGIDQESVAVEGTEERGVPEPREPRPVRVAVDEIGIRFDDRRRRTGRQLAATAKEAICDPPTQNGPGPVWAMARILVAVPMSQRSTSLSIERWNVSTLERWEKEKRGKGEEGRMRGRLFPFSHPPLFPSAFMNV
jgi:hypothetical protein